MTSPLHADLIAVVMEFARSKGPAQECIEAQIEIMRHERLLFMSMTGIQMAAEDVVAVGNSMVYHPAGAPELYLGSNLLFAKAKLRERGLSKKTMVQQAKVCSCITRPWTRINPMGAHPVTPSEFLGVIAASRHIHADFPETQLHVLDQETVRMLLLLVLV